MTIDEYYRYVFENEERLQELAAEKEMTPLEYMKHHGAFEASTNDYELHEDPLAPEVLAEDDVFVDQYGTIRRWTDEERVPTVVERADGETAHGYNYEKVTVDVTDSHPATETLGVMVDGEPKRGFPSPTGKQQFYSKTLADWGWDDEKYTLPHYLKSHVHPDNIDYENGEMVFVPTFRLPTQIHSRSSNSKYLEEISHNNPVWVHTSDADRLGVETGNLVRIETEIGYFVNEVWVTESIKPGLVAMSHHMGQWKVNREETNSEIEEGGDGFGKVTVDLDNNNNQWGMRQAAGITPFESDDPDSERIWWNDGGVAQNLTHAPHPDPISGMHCWHQKVTVRPAEPDDYYGDIYVDTDRAFDIYRDWLEDTNPAPGPNGLRRPKWLKRPIAPPTAPGEDDAWYVDGPVGRHERWDADSRSPIRENSSPAEDD